MDSIVSIIVSAVTACFSWLDNLLSAFGGTDIVFAGLIVFLVSRFLLAPLIGGISRGSDQVKSSKKDVDV